MADSARERVLVAEDDLTSRRILETILSRWGLDVTVVDNGTAALEQLSAEDPPQLAILDWVMPGMTGLEVCARARQAESERPLYIVILTARDTKEDLVEALDSGADDYIAKPFDLAELRARIGVGRRVVELQSKLAEANAILAHQATHDPLTRVLNRGAIMNVLERELVRSNRESSTLTIALCDLDHFKKINDTFGHLVGDDVLLGFAERAQAAIRPYDRIGRWGGEEFLIVAPGLADNPELGILRRICQVTAARPMVSRVGRDVPLTISIGVALARGKTGADELLAKADEALYQAKEEGRNRVVYAPE